MAVVAAFILNAVTIRGGPAMVSPDMAFDDKVHAADTKRFRQKCRLFRRRTTIPSSHVDINARFDFIAEAVRALRMFPSEVVNAQTCCRNDLAPRSAASWRQKTDLKFDGSIALENNNQIVHAISMLLEMGVVDEHELVRSQS